MALSRRPGILAWGLGLTSLAAVLLLGLAATVAVSCLTAALGYRNIQTLSFRGELQIEELRRYLDFSLGEHFIFRFLGDRFLESGPFRAAPKPDPLLVSGIAEVLVSLSRSDADAAFSRARVLFSELPIDNFLDDTALHDHLLRLHERGEAHVRLRRELKLEQDVLHDGERRLANTLQRHALLANDVGDLFSLPPEYESAAPADFSVYSDGILANLPRIRGLADNIPDLVALRSELEAGGGRVNLPSEDQHALFQQKIDSFRSASRELLDEGADYEMRIKQGRDNAARVEKELSIVSSASRHDCEQLLTQLAEPRLTSFYPPIAKLMGHNSLE